jgi:hypothetical protein
MAGYLLWFPGKQGISNRTLIDCGLSDLARDKGPEWVPLDCGPDKNAGMLALWRRGDSANDPVPALLPSQDWQPCRRAGEVPAGAYWVGIDRKRPVTPADIARSQQHAGYWVTMHDGQSWHCPSVELLPNLHGLNEAGEYCRTVDPQFADFAGRCLAYRRKLVGAAQTLDGPTRAADAPPVAVVEMDLASAFAFVVECLALNYRLSAELVHRLQLIDDAALRNVIKAAVDLPMLMEKRKPQRDTLGIDLPDDYPESVDEAGEEVPTPKRRSRRRPTDHSTEAQKP